VSEYKPPKRPPTQVRHLERMVDQYSSAHGIALDRVRRWMTTMVMIGALDRVQVDPTAPLFLIKAPSSSRADRLVNTAFDEWRQPDRNSSWLRAREPAGCSVARSAAGRPADGRRPPVGTVVGRPDRPRRGGGGDRSRL
jgi:hypothetical protein